MRVLQCGEREMIKEISVIRRIVATFKKKEKQHRECRWWFFANTG